MASKLFFALFLAIYSLASVCLAQQSGGGDNGGGASSLPCVQKLLPCQDALVSRSTPPPSTCCIPLNQIIQDDLECLCKVFNNPVLLKVLNVTQDDGLSLAKSCHSTTDTSLCGAAAGNPPALSPVTPSAPATSNSSSSTAKPSKSAVAGMKPSFEEPAAISFALFMLLSIVGLI